MVHDDSANIDVTIRLDKSQANRIDSIVKALSAAGLQSVSQHNRFMIVTGTVASDRLEDLRAIPGVASVRQDKTYGVRLPGKP